MSQGTYRSDGRKIRKSRLHILGRVELQKNAQCLCKTIKIRSTQIRQEFVPETEDISSLSNVKYSMAYREASGDGGLCEGGVGKDAEGAAAEIRASREEEFGPSKMRCART